MSTAPTQVAAGVHRLGNDLVNFYLIEDEGRLTLVDAGLPRHRGQLESALHSLGRTPADLEAVILTHAHSDHVGFAGRLQRDAGTPVHVHELDADMARTARAQKRERSMLPYLRNRATLQLFATFLREGGLPQKVAHPAPFSDGAVLDVPGHPRVVHAPGHSNGCVVFHLADRGVLLAGDVVVTRNPLTGRLGPQIMSGGFNVSSTQALDSLSRLEPLEAGVLLPGHGDPWTGAVGEAVALAREAGPS
jgi:glyoxylase-like metal-dependent hydrolase (beta-lactamase superfamily II)